MAKSIVAPCRYYQGTGLLTDAYRYVSHIGRNFIVICDTTVRDIIKDKMDMGFRSAGSTCEYLIFNGECCQSEIKRLISKIDSKRYDGIVGAGGGKTLDAAKILADHLSLPVIMVPTIASNDSACSFLASIYTEDGSFLKIQKLKSSPEVVLVDAEVITSAPVRYLVAGMGEDISSYYDAVACDRSGVQNYTGGQIAQSVLAMAKLCLDLIIENGPLAVAGYETKNNYIAFAKVIEAVIYLSAIVFQNSGCAASQGIFWGMTTVVKPFPAMQGEGVAYGCLVQRVLEYEESGRWDMDDWRRLTDFYRKVRLPMRLEDLGINDVSDELMHSIAKASCREGSHVHHMPFLVTEEKLFAAIKKLQKMELSEKLEKHND